MKNIFTLALVPFFLIGCSSEYADPIGQLVSHRNTSISLSSFSEESIDEYMETLAGEKNGYHCVNFLYGYDQQYFYSWVLCSDFSVVDGELVEAPAVNGPVRLTYDEGNKILAMEQPEEGKDYGESLRALFPESVYKTMQLTDEELQELMEKLWETPRRDFEIQREEALGNVVMESWEFDVPLSQNGLMRAEESSSTYLAPDPQYWVEVPGADLSALLSPNKTYAVYYDAADFTLHKYTPASGADEILMTFYDTTLSVDFKISPDGTKIAAVAYNMEEKTYWDSLGTKLFLFTVDDSGAILERDTHSIVIYHQMSNEGFYSTSWYFYFDENNDFVYLGFLEADRAITLQKKLDL